MQYRGTDNNDRLSGFGQADYEHEKEDEENQRPRPEIVQVEIKGRTPWWRKALKAVGIRTGIYAYTVADDIIERNRDLWGGELPGDTGDMLPGPSTVIFCWDPRENLARDVGIVSIDCDDALALSQMAADFAVMLAEGKRAIATLQHEAEEAAGAFDANVLRLKACECIAEGEEGWQTVRDACPSAAAVATLRDQFEALQREADGLREALERIAAGDGVYGAQAHEYKQIARAAKEHGFDPRYAGFDRVAVAEPMPEIEPPEPEAYPGISARNARRLAKKRRRK